MTNAQKLDAAIKALPILSSYVFTCRQIGMTDEEIVARLKASLATIQL